MTAVGLGLSLAQALPEVTHAVSAVGFTPFTRGSCCRVGGTGIAIAVPRALQEPDLLVRRRILISGLASALGDVTACGWRVCSPENEHGDDDTYGFSSILHRVSLQLSSLVLPSRTGAKSSACSMPAIATCRPDSSGASTGKVARSVSGLGSRVAGRGSRVSGLGDTKSRLHRGLHRSTFSGIAVQASEDAMQVPITSSLSAPPLPSPPPTCEEENHDCSQAPRRASSRCPR